MSMLMAGKDERLRVVCTDCGEHGSRLHMLCHCHWDEFKNEMVFGETSDFDWFCDTCGCETHVEEKIIKPQMELELND